MVAAVRIHTRELRALAGVLAGVLAALGATVVSVVTRGERPGPAEPLVPAARSLVVLVHGFAGSSRCWADAARALHRPGVAVVTHGYSSWGASVAELGAALAERVETWARRSGAREVTLVGHSLGGVVVAASVADGRLAGTVTRVVTIAAPLRGSVWARVFPVGVVRSLRHGSPVLGALAAVAHVTGVPWLALASRMDVVVPPRRATLDAAELVVIDGAGHCGMLQHAGVIAHIAAAVDRRGGPAAVGPRPVAAA